mgnify:CR=1 FL=1
MKETKGRRTSIGNVARILSCNSMAKVVKAEYRYKALTPTEVTPIDTTTMLKSIESLAKNIVFADLRMYQRHLRRKILLSMVI